MKQTDKIIELCKDKGFVCQIQFWNLFIRSPHKRRSDIAKEGKYYFETRKCEHGVKNGFDYQMKEKIKTTLW